MRAFFLLTLLAGSGSLLYAAEAEDWLVRLAQSEHGQTYSGIFVYERNGSFSTHAVWHAADRAGAWRERLLQLDGPEQEVILVNGRIQCASAGLDYDLLAAPLGPAHGFDLARISTVYQANINGPSRVAGRPGVVVTLIPRDHHRYARELHLDAATGLQLKSLLLNEQGQLLERLQFTSLSPQERLGDTALQPATDCQPVQVSARPEHATSPWQVGWTPPGFTLTGISTGSDTASDATLQTLVFDDGLTRFTVIVEALPPVPIDNAHSQVGPTAVVSRRVVGAWGELLVTVVGEIPPATAEQIALSVIPSGAAGP